MDQQEYPREQQFKSAYVIPRYYNKENGTIGARHKPNKTGPQITQLWDRHHIMKRMALTGARREDIAETVGCSLSTVNSVMNSAIMQKELALAHGALDKEAIDIAKEIQAMHPQALKVLSEIMNDINAPISLRAKVAMDNLSRGGYSPVVRGNLNIEHSFSRDEIEAIKRDAINSGIRLGNIVDAEYKELPSSTAGESACQPYAE